MSSSVLKLSQVKAGGSASLAAILIATVSFIAGEATAQNMPTLRVTTPQATVEQYWTPERLKSAQPVEKRPSTAPTLNGEPAPSKGSPQSHSGKGPTVEFDPSAEKQLYVPDPPAQRTQADSAAPQNHGTGNAYFTTHRMFPAAAYKAWPNSAAGKLYFTDTVHGGNYVCSASAISPRVVVTAGHCVAHASTTAPHFYGNFLYVPATANGSAPYKSWLPVQVWTTSNWYNSNGGVPNVQDTAVMVMQDQPYRRATRRLGDVTGWLGWWTLWGRTYPNHVTQIGYPCNLDSCSVPQVNSAQGVGVSNNTVMIGSAMQGGSSGGPWIQDYGIAGSGSPAYTAGNWVLGTTSWGYVDANIKIQGASRFENAGYPGGGFGDLWNAACAQATGNC